MKNNSVYRHLGTLRYLTNSLLVCCLSLGGSAALAQALEEVVVTAQKREVNLQSAALAITAYTGDSLKRDRIFNVKDLASNVPAFSLTAGTPLDLELNIRGVTNTRLDSPTSDPSVGLFVDEVYVGRTGGMNTDFYDLERIEVIRGPQGVLLGKNVVGGALSVITAKPEFENSGEISIGRGNYDSSLVSGFVTGPLTDSLAGRFSLQSRSHDGYARDIFSDRELENLDSDQFRAQLLYRPEDGDLSVRLGVDYSKDSSNGISPVAIPDDAPAGLRPWSTLRRFLGITDPRKSAPERSQYAGNSFSETQYLRRESTSVTLHIEKTFDSFVLNSITGYRDGKSALLYDQTGIGPDVLNILVDPTLFNQFLAAEPVAATFLFSEPVNEQADIMQISQEFRLTSNYDDSRWDWIAGVYFQKDEIDKFDRFIGENPSGVGALATLTGESHWDNRGEMESMAIFGQVGFNFTEALKLTVGARYTRDEKEGVIDGLAVATGDVYNPADTEPLTPLVAPFTNVNYSESWSKFTPQAIVEYQATDDLFFYASYATGFKGGGFDDTPANAVAAQIAFDPEEVENIEVGFKSDLWDGRMRLNASIFYMDYTDLQVTQTNQDCLCNLTDNASDAKIEGVEFEFQVAITEALRVEASGSYLNTEYKDFIESSGVDSSGNVLQRTPEQQANVNVNYTTGFGRWENALNFHISYTWQDELYWQPANTNDEDSYGLLDARITLDPEDTQWAVSLWGKNLEDKLYRTNIIPFFGEEVSQFGAPRTYGVDVRFSF